MDYAFIVAAFNCMAQEAHQNAVDHGFYEVVPSLMERLMLMVTELAEAAEECRDGNPLVYYECGHPDESVKGKPCRGCGIADKEAECEYRKKKPEGIGSELADCVLRVFDTCAEQGIDIGALIVEKHQYNKNRPYKHGGKVL